MESDLFFVILMSIFVSGTATMLAAALGIPLGGFLGLKEFRGKGLVKTLTYTLYGFPPVVAGLLVYLMISSNGPLGSLNLLFTPTAMIIAQMILVFPIITGLTMSAVNNSADEVKETAIVLGADQWQTAKTIMHESKPAITSAVMVGFGRAIAEVGAVMMVGGNIKWSTRVLTTAIVLETRQGNFEYGIALGIVLLAVAMIVFYFLKMYQEKGGSTRL